MPVSARDAREDPEGAFIENSKKCTKSGINFSVSAMTFY